MRNVKASEASEASVVQRVIAHNIVATFASFGEEAQFRATADDETREVMGTVVATAVGVAAFGLSMCAVLAP